MNETMITLENERLAVRILPALGGKITSFRLKEEAFELAAPNRKGVYRFPDIQSGEARGNVGPVFSEYDASGLDDAFPNIDPSEVEWKGRKLFFPDHGEVWSSPMRAQETADGILLSFTSGRFGYLYEKRLQLRENGLILRYRIENRSREELPFLWTFHGLMRYEEDMRLLLPPDLENYRNVLPHPVLGEEGRIHPAHNGGYDFSRVPPASAASMVKFYGEGRTKAGQCGLWYPSRGVACTLRYDAAALPYLGIWITAGGYRGDYNCALEPSTGFYDAVPRARAHGSLRVLKPGAVFDFSLEIDLEKRYAGV